MRVLLYVVRRLIGILLVLWIVYTLSFALMYSVPGGPFDEDRKLDPETQRQIEARYGLDEPLHVQYGNALAAAVFRFDLGPCYKRDFSVNEVIAQGFPISIALGLFALTFALVLGLTTGVVSALLRGSGVDFGVMTVAAVGIALPNFFIAGLVILVFVFWIPLFPAAGWGSLRDLVLPGFCLGAPYAAYLARLSRTGMLEVLGQDYVRTAVAKGMPMRRVVFQHALRGAMLPVVSFLGPATAGILTGSLVVERIFAIPGLGTHFIQAALERDYLLALGMVVLYTILLSTMNLLVDFAYGILDPRVKLE